MRRHVASTFKKRYLPPQMFSNEHPHFPKGIYLSMKMLINNLCLGGTYDLGETLE